MSEVISLVRANAQVVQIQELNVGDYYTRLVSDGGDDYKTRIGVVRDIKFNGEDAVVLAYELYKSYGSWSTETKTFGTSKNLVLFACNEQEVIASVNNALKDLREDIDDARAKVIKHIKVLEEVQEFTDYFKDIHFQAQQKCIDNTLVQIENDPIVNPKEIDND
jgi:hypothetical protein